MTHNCQLIPSSLLFGLCAFSIGCEGTGTETDPNTGNNTIGVDSEDHDDNGFTVDDGDCNDYDESVFRGAADTYGDGTDGQGCATPDPETRPEDLTVAKLAWEEEDAVDDDSEGVVAGQFVVGFEAEAFPELRFDRDRGVEFGDEVLDQAWVQVGSAAPSRKFSGNSRTGLLQFDSALSRDELASLLEDIEGIDWVEPVYEVEAFTSPDDPYFSYQWHMSMIGAPGAWEMTKGDGVIVAVLDTGVEVNEDGFGDLLPGYDFVDDDEDVSDAGSAFMHGTHVAGTVAQYTNNSVGTTGVAPYASILPVRVAGPDGGMTIDVAQGIAWAVDEGADIINLSLGSDTMSHAIKAACSYAEEEGVLVVAAAGNDGAKYGVSYPAALENVLAVGAVDLNGDVTLYSSQGPEIDLVAPGGDTSRDLDGDGFVDGVLQETRSGVKWGYVYAQGTSMAAPHVAGVAALVMSTGLSDLEEVKNALMATAEDVGAEGVDDATGHGMVDAVAAVNYAINTVGAVDFIAVDAVLAEAGEVLLTIEADTNVSIEVEGDDGSLTADESFAHKHEITLVQGDDVVVTYRLRATAENGARSMEEFELDFENVDAMEPLAAEDEAGRRAGGCGVVPIGGSPLLGWLALLVAFCRRECVRASI